MSAPRSTRPSPRVAAKLLLMVELRGSTGLPQMAGIGAPSPLQSIPAIVSFLNPQPALSLGGGNHSSCPKADPQCHEQTVRSSEKPRTDYLVGPASSEPSPRRDDLAGQGR